MEDKKTCGRERKWISKEEAKEMFPKSYEHKCKSALHKDFLDGLKNSPLIHHPMPKEIKKIFGKEK